MAGGALLVTVTWVWFQLLGFQLLVLWQLRQLVEPTGMCVPDLPVAALPLWQLAQLVAAVKPLWSTLAPAQLAVDLWQLSQLRHAVVDRRVGLATAGGLLPV